MKSSKKSTEESKQLDCFRSIDDLPIKAWFNIHKTGDYRFLLKESITIDEKDFEYFDDILIGEDVFYLGFPFNLTPRERFVPVFRKGCIAQKFPNELEVSIGDYRKISFTEKQMIIDAHVSKGNSGCPVFTSPHFKSTKKGVSMGPYFIGIVRSHIESNIKDSYILKEHSGLGEIYSTDTVVELLNQMIEISK